MMSIRFMGLAVTVSILLAVASYADDNHSEQAATPTPAATDTQGDQTSYLDKVICKHQPPPIGSHLGGKMVCLTERQWLQLQNQSQDELNKLQRNLGGAASH